MNIWAVFISEDHLTEDLYQSGLVLLDFESQARIKRFYHKIDSYRCLIGRLLPRLLLIKYGIPQKEIIFGRTDAGKPFVATPHLERTIGFNVSHDNACVVMAFQTCQLDELPTQVEGTPQTTKKMYDVSTVGVDVMKIALPRYEQSLGSFVNSISHALTPTERHALLEKNEASDEDDGVSLKQLFLIWTLKEAYTKAIGLGLGFDFRRVEVDLLHHRLTIDGRPPSGWEFIAFNIERDGEPYQIASARFIGDMGGGVGRDGHVDVRGLVSAADWLEQYDAESLIKSVS